MQWVGHHKIAIVCSLIVFLSSSAASAGWRIDAARFSQSAHGNTSCADCHADIETLSRHPEPANVNKKMSVFFEPDKCLACHDYVQGQIEDDGEHGGETVKDTQRFFKCIECHDPHYEGAPEQINDAQAGYLTGEDNTCMTCHQAVQSKAPDSAEKNRRFCYACHAAGKDMPANVPVMAPDQFLQSTHANLDCLTCHPKADQYEHHLQNSVDCAQCHDPHQESVAHEAHTGVSCQACHLGHVVPVRDAKANAVLWERAALPGTISTLHNLSKPDGQGCARCHFDKSPVGAAAMILPSKSVICMPCHTATLTVADTNTLIALAIFAIGLVGFVSLWFSASFADTAGKGVVGSAFWSAGHVLKSIFSTRFGMILKTIWYDVLLQRRLYQRSVGRWAVHALIFWPFVIRLCWAVAAMVSTNWLKGWPLAWVLINKNHPFTALIFDLTGLCLVLGILFALVRGGEADKKRTSGLPSQDRLALLLIGAIALIGFLLEGMRIAMTQAQGPAAYAFIGYGISKLFVGMKDLSDVYGYIWYLHAVFTGAFVAYLPFSRMMHIIMSPVVLAMNAAAQKNHH